MAATIQNNLYPPIIRSSYMPAFLYTDYCQIYFKLSDFNSVDELNADRPVQIIIQDIKTNKTVLKSDTYPSGIKLSNLHTDNTRETDDKYFVRIDNSDIKGGFKLNHYYKVQLRLTAAGAATPPGYGGLDTWLNNNLDFFSEWSTVVLVYGISQPSLSLKNLVKEETVTLNNITIPITGRMSFANNKDTETLKSYKIKIYKDNDLLQETDDIFPTNKNEIYYMIKYNILYNSTYTVIVSATTKNLYTLSQTYYIKYLKDQDSDFDINLSVDLQEESGSIHLLFKSKQTGTSGTTGKTINIPLIEPSIIKPITETNATKISGSSEFPVNSVFTLRRASSKNNFNYWETLYEIKIAETPITELVFKDYTVQPGAWYKYQIIRKLSNGNISSLRVVPRMVAAEDIFLSSNNRQLRIRFDPQVSSVSIKTSEALIETLGSQYPFIRRNAQTYYRTFSLSGTITALMDARNNLFKASEEEIYGDAFDLYQTYKDDNNVSPLRNYIYEKDFRERVMKFLYANDVKLLRSLTEGNVLVRLMNVSLSPNNSLGRLIYTFSCTAYEIDKANFESYNKYKESNHMEE